MWRIITRGPHTSTTKINKVLLPKPEKDWDVNDKMMTQLNAKAINILYCSLDIDEFNRISTYTLVKKIWKRLKIIYEGISQVKKSKINLLVHKYEIFKIKKYDSIFNIFFKFFKIINTLNSLGKTYTSHELVCKILRSLLKEWKAKLMVI